MKTVWLQNDRQSPFSFSTTHTFQFYVHVTAFNKIFIKTLIFVAYNQARFSGLSSVWVLALQFSFMLLGVAQSNFPWRLFKI